MTNPMHRAGPLTLAGFFLILSACQQTGAKTDLVSVDSPETSPSVVGSSEQTQWEYLVAKYDVDRDARITSAEYGRGVEPFSRLDHDGNGALEAADFEGGGAGMQMDPAEMRRMISPMILARYFQADEEAEELTRKETIDSFGVFDADGNGRVTRPEFEAEATTRGATASGRMDRFALFTQSVGGEDAGDFDLGQLTAYFDSLDDDGDQTIDTPGGMSGRGRARESGVREEVDDAPNAVGRPAPDFALERIHGEEDAGTVRLSSFAGKKPVALIFGSYT